MTSREHLAANDESSASTAADTTTPVRRNSRFPFSTYPGRFSGTTRMFRDPTEPGSGTRRFSSVVYSSRLAGATRTFRDPIVSHGLETAGTPGGRSSTGRRGGSRSDMDRMTSKGASDSSPTTSPGGNQASTAYGGSRRASLFEWLVPKKGTGGAEFSEYVSAVESGSDEQQDAVHDEEQDLGRGFSDYESSMNMNSLRRESAVVEVAEEGATATIPSIDNISSDPPLTAEVLEQHTRTHSGGKNNRSESRSSATLNGNDTRDILTASAGRSLPRPRGTSMSSRTGGDDEAGDAVLPEFHQSHDETQEEITIDEPTTPAAADIEDIYADDVTHGESRRVTFLSRTMGLTVDISDPMQPQPPDEIDREHRQQHKKHNEYDQWPASPCSGVILDTSPRYGTLQAFRKEMASRGINAQMFHTGWKGSFLPPRDIRLFMTDSRKASVLYWRYKTGPFGRRTAAGGNQGLGAEDRRVIPLSSLANIGPAELYRHGAPSSRRNLLSWLSIPSSLRRANGDSPVDYRKIQKDKDLDGVDNGKAGLVEAVPVLALSYWVEGKPRWVGDHPKRLLVMPDSLDSFQRLSHGLRLCCLHFHNYSCPQDLEDIR
ncbi:unnamed protein product [Ectocarpus sp. CCAP 1310/34]|nr:unnamed protein product [Ectocarpus sp. CCAP 1310/34]